jgi:hypothetical protein
MKGKALVALSCSFLKRLSTEVSAVTQLHEGTLINLVGLPAIEYKANGVDAALNLSSKIVNHCLECDGCSFIEGIAVRAGADRRESDTLKVVFCGHF